MIHKLLMIDNYDSFTYNLVQRLGEIDPDVDLRVVRNDRMTAGEIAALKPTHVIISPGPCTPKEAGVSLAILRELSAELPILGVCLGHQCIGEAFGGRVVRAARLMHGKTSPVVHDGKTIFESIPNPFSAMRYHSLLVEWDTVPDCLEISARTEENEIMGFRHKTLSVEGVQFHPESVGTPEGKHLLETFLRRIAT